MNRLILSIVLLAAMAAGCFYSVYLTTQRTDELSGLIDQVEQAHSGGDDKSALEYAELSSSTHHGTAFCITAFLSTTWGTQWK